MSGVQEDQGAPSSDAIMSLSLQAVAERSPPAGTHVQDLEQLLSSGASREEGDSTGSHHPPPPAVSKAPGRGRSLPLCVQVAMETGISLMPPGQRRPESASDSHSRAGGFVQGSPAVGPSIVIHFIQAKRTSFIAVSSRGKNSFN